MFKQLISLAAAAAFATTVSAQQQIDVSLGGAWTSTPICQQTINQFNSNNGAGAVIFGGCTAEVGTSLGGCYTRATATVQGQNTGSGSITDGSSATAGTIEYDFHPSGGSANCTLNATPESPVRNLRGSGISGRTMATVLVTCPFFGWLRAKTSTRASGQIATVSTLPVSASGSGSGLTQFSVNMSAGSTATGTMTQLGDAIQIFSGANATGTVTLF